MHPQQQLPHRNIKSLLSKLKGTNGVAAAFVIGYAFVMLTTYFVLPMVIDGDTSGKIDLAKRWGDGPNPSPKCDRQARIATLLSFLLGPLGVDQFYAHHWVCATFKLVVSWLGSSVYSYGRIRDSIGFMTMGRVMAVGSAVWCLADLILWIVGGHYGTPGCPVGNPAWQH